MNSQIKMQAVVETPYIEETILFPWPIAEVKPFSMLCLSGEMTCQEIGLVVAQLAQYNQIEFKGSQKTILEKIIEEESLILPGGIQTISEKKVINPSCCCGLEKWREWLDFFKTGHSPWLGHDPSPWIENRGESIRIWADGGIDEASRNTFYIDVSRTHLKQSLTLVEKDLQAFQVILENWAKDIGFAMPKRLSQKFCDDFQVRI